MLDWQTDVRPVLVALYELMHGQGPPVPITPAEIAVAAGRPRDEEQANTVLSYLKDAGYIDGSLMIDQTTAAVVVEVHQLNEKALQEVAGWPVPGSSEQAMSKMLAAVDAQIAEAQTPEERTRLKKLRSAVEEVGTRLITNVLTKMATEGL